MNANTIQPEIAYKLNSRILFFDGIFSLIAIIAFIFSLNILGISLIIVGTIIFLAKAKQETYLPTNSVIKKYSIFFDKQDMAALEKIINGNLTDETKYIKPNDSGTCKVEVTVSRDKEYIAIQLYRFVPYFYEKAADQIFHTGTKAKEIGNYFEICRKG